MSKDVKNVSGTVKLTRRGVLQTMVAAGTFVLSAPVLGKSFAQEIMPLTGLNPSVYLAIESDGSIAITCHRVEMGQGSTTGLPMIIMDELDADWSRMKFIQGGGDKKYGDQNTDGSTSIRKFYETFRKAGATARLMLEQAAANKWGVDVSKVSTKDHAVHLGDKSFDFKELVADAASLPVPSEDKLTFKSKAKRKYVGTGQRIIDMQDMVTGNATFGQDVRRDGMLYAVIARPPVVGGKVVSFDASKAIAVNGVVDVIQMPDAITPTVFNPLGGVAVVATNTWAALKARKALSIKWDDGPNAGINSKEYDADLLASTKGENTAFLNRGDVDSALAAADKVVTASYTVPYQTHAPMEPPAATADWATKEIWTCCQDPQAVQAAVGGYMKAEPESISVMPTLLGGAFGRKSKPDFSCEAAWLSAQTKKPLKVVWTREDEIRHGFYHATSAQTVSGGLDAGGKAIAWKHTANYPSIMATFDGQQAGPSGFEVGLGLTDLPWELPNLQANSGKAKWHARVGWMRSVCNIQQAFAIGSFVDEMAHEAGRDPKDFLLELIGSDRHINPADDGAKYSNYGESLDKHPIDTARLKAVVNKAAEMAGWGRKMPKGRGLGIAVQRSFVSYVATVVEVNVDKAGELTIPNAWTAVDCGLAVNTDRVKAQMEGALVFGMSIFKHSEITFADGKVEQGNFDDYLLTRTGEVGTVKVEIMPMEDAPPGGVGEPGVPPAAPAIANAVFAATGKRIRNLPLGDQLA